MKRIPKYLALILSVVFAAAMLFACAPAAPAAEPTKTAEPAVTAAPAPAQTAAPAAPEAKKYTIAFSLKTITNDAFQKAIADSIQTAVEGAGHEFILVTAESQTAVATQVKQIEDLIAKGVDAMIVSPMDSNAVIPALKKVKEAGIPVVLVDQGIAAGNEDLYLTFIATDNYNCGKMAGERMVKELGGEGNVLMVRGANGSSAGDDRADGFKKGLEGSNIKVVGEQPGDWVVDKAMQVTENMLQGNKQVDGVFTCSDNMLPGILQALQNNEREGVKIISVDGSKAGCDLIGEGLVLGTMAQFPAKMGPIAVEKLLGVLDGTIDPVSIEKVIDSGTMVYDKSNLDEAAKWYF